MTDLEELNAADSSEFASMVGPLFEHAPRFLGRLSEARPFPDADELFATARAIARSMPEEDQVELLNAHPRIGAAPAAMSDLSRREQGDDHAGGHPGAAWIADELASLNEAYEGHFGFRYVIFVAGRPRADIIPLLERALRADRDEELRRGLDDVVLIAEDRWEKLRTPTPSSEPVREAIALEISRWMVGELDRDGLRRAAHRLVDDGVTSPALVDLSIAAGEDDAPLEPPIARVLAEIGLGGWDGHQAGQLLALHAAASIIGQVSQPIDGARRIVAVAPHPEFSALVRRWESNPESRGAVDEEIRRAAGELFGPPEDHTEEERAS
ncbi:MAG: 2-oxo-4-hydroxy-4-carboxy-5-ureidoimidazoline decarboxylase [Chloroflexi bacterium]|nr:2-oxo-4-hydroxy-4-carboxy-5-ureidoimidazoline decarboxylase [Chloroflexota bacterium]